VGKAQLLCLNGTRYFTTKGSQRRHSSVLENFGAAQYIVILYSLW